jgi:DNA polymerase-1
MALAYRAHFALLKSPLSTSRGEPTSAVFGFLSTLKQILDQERPDRIAVVFDAEGPTFRHTAYAEYKATRDKMPEELPSQLAWIQKVVRAQGIPFLAVPGYEADDVIGTLAKREAERGHDVWIVSGDKDMMQLVGPRVRLYNVMKPGADGVDLVDETGVRAKFGVPPEKVVEVMALMGDASDNVPGVPGVGEKTAPKLIQDYGSLEGVIAAVASIPQRKLAERIAENVEQARLSKRLVTIDTAVPLHAEWDDLAPRPPDAKALREAYLALEFKRFLASATAGAEAPPDDVTYVTVDSPAGVDALVASLAATRARGGFALDTETTGVDPMRAELVGLSVAFEPRKAYYVPLNREPPIFGGDVERVASDGGLFDGVSRSGDTQEVLRRLGPVLEDASVPKTGQNAKYDWHVLKEHGVEVEGVTFDTMVADFCLDPDGRAHNLDAMSLWWLGVTKIPTSDLIGTGKGQVTMREVPIERVSRYACEDADCTWRLRGLLEPELAAKGVERVFREVEMPLLPVLCRMEHTGIRLDTSVLARIGADLDARAKRLEEEIYAAAGGPLNLRSNAQLGELLFDRLRLHETTGRRKPRKTEKGTGWATDERTLLEFADAHPIPRRLLDWRTLTKLKSTYVDTLPTYVHPRTGRVHTTFSQIGAATGRLSSSDPNLQNIPVRGEEGRSIRTAFVPEAGWTLVSADYSQVELRLLAHLADDPGLLAAFRSGEDVHRATAAKVFGVPPAAVTAEMRGRAKAINFGIVYGMGPQRLAAETKVSLADAQAFIEAYFAIYPRVRAYQERLVEEARTTGYVSTLLGRRRYLKELNDADARLRSQAERIAVNTPIQGTAADLIKVAMIRVDRRLATERFRARMLLQVHDELVFEAPPDEVERLTAMVRAEMSGALDLSVPIVVDVGTGPSWAEAH